MSQPLGGACVGLLVLSGCFAEVTTAYQPSSTVRVMGAAPVEHTESTFSVGLSIGFYLDFYGVAVSYAPAGAGGVRAYSAAGLPDHYAGSGYRVRADTDLPFRFAHSMLGMRATYAYQKFSQGTAGPGAGGGDTIEDIPMSGATHLAGATIVGPSHDLGLTIGVTRTSMRSQMSGAWPEASLEGWGVGASMLVRFVPSAAYIKYTGGTRRWAFNFGCSTTPTCSREIQGMVCTYHC